MIMMRREMITAPPVENVIPLWALASLSLSSAPPASSAMEEPRKRLKPMVVVAPRLRTVFALPGGMVGIKPSQNLLMIFILTIDASKALWSSPAPV